MTDDELNKKLAEAMNIKPEKVRTQSASLLPEVSFFNPVNYKDPAIFAENVKWLARKNLHLQPGAWEGLFEIVGTDWVVEDEDPCKAVALARIEASQHE